MTSPKGESSGVCIMMVVMVLVSVPAGERQKQFRLVAGKTQRVED